MTCYEIIVLILRKGNEGQSGKFVYGFVCGKGYLINNFVETNDPNFEWLAIRAIYWI